ncbi:hypothetical protein AU461_23255 [Vibrio parahaemolyticus]|nr:hypothetical protein AU461_23255 [Vibrio parahaemolyticus]KYX47713.1 hypothetical protein AU389_01910 [Vibrio parahaemolyticus]
MTRSKQMAFKKITKLCDEMETLICLMEKANRSGDDAEREIAAGVTLLMPLINEIKGVAKQG